MQIGKPFSRQTFRHIVEKVCGSLSAISFCVFCGEMRTPVRSAPATAATASTTSSKNRAAILDAAAVAVGALVGLIAQELVDQIAVGGMHLDAVETRR